MKRVFMPLMMESELRLMPTGILTSRFEPDRSRLYVPLRLLGGLEGYDDEVRSLVLVPGRRAACVDPTVSRRATFLVIYSQVSWAGVVEELVRRETERGCSAELSDGPAADDLWTTASLWVYPCKLQANRRLPIASSELLNETALSGTREVAWTYGTRWLGAWNPEMLRQYMETVGTIESEYI